MSPDKLFVLKEKLFSYESVVIWWTFSLVVFFWHQRILFLHIELSVFTWENWLRGFLLFIELLSLKDLRIRLRLSRFRLR